MSNLKRVLSGGSTLSPAKKAAPAARGFVKISRLETAISLGRVVLINVLALVATAAATVHVFQREHRPAPAAHVEEQASGAASATPTLAAPAASTSAPSAPIEVDFEQAAPAVTGRVPTAPTVNGMTGR
jgi:Mn2+/Fe2+ NRAMP family transporter